MLRDVTRGSVQAGCGRAAPAFTAERIRELVALFGWAPYPGTLNLQLRDELNTAVDRLGEPDALTEHDTPIGPLRWWRVYVELPGGIVHPGLVVRGARTRTRYLELVAAVRLRDHGLVDGSGVIVMREP